MHSVAVHAFGHGSHAASSDSPESLVNQFYDLAQKGSKPDSSLVSSLNSSLETKGSSFGPQEIANLLWSVAKTGTKLDPKVLASLVGLVSAKAGSFKPAQIAAVLWALGSLGQKVDSGRFPACVSGSLPAHGGQSTCQLSVLHTAAFVLRPLVSLAHCSFCFEQHKCQAGARLSER